MEKAEHAMEATAARLAAPQDDAAAGPIIRRPLQEEVAARLRDLITQGEIPAGGRINEVALGARLPARAVPQPRGDEDGAAP